LFLIKSHPPDQRPGQDSNEEKQTHSAEERSEPQTQRQALPTQKVPHREATEKAQENPKTQEQIILRV
jgi:hypothetical protein